jgi:exportin-2 (importin alpha re-exporter)
LTESFKQLLPPLLMAPVWLRRGNVPALTSLICAYARKGALYMSQSGQLLPMLGVFQKLLGQRPHEDFAFDMLCALGKCSRRVAMGTTHCAWDERDQPL